MTYFAFELVVTEIAKQFSSLCRWAWIQNDLVAFLTELRLYSPHDTEQVILETFFLANLLAWYWRN